MMLMLYAIILAAPFLKKFKYEFFVIKNDKAAVSICPEYLYGMYTEMPKKIK